MDSHDMHFKGSSSKGLSWIKSIQKHFDKKKVILINYLSSFVLMMMIDESLNFDKSMMTNYRIKNQSQKTTFECYQAFLGVMNQLELMNVQDWEECQRRGREIQN